MAEKTDRALLPPRGPGRTQGLLSVQELAPPTFTTQQELKQRGNPQGLRFGGQTPPDPIKCYRTKGRLQDRVRSVFNGSLGFTFPVKDVWPFKMFFPSVLMQNQVQLNMLTEISTDDCCVKTLKTPR